MTMLIGARRIRVPGMAAVDSNIQAFRQQNHWWFQKEDQSPSILEWTKDTRHGTGYFVSADCFHETFSLHSCVRGTPAAPRQYGLLFPKTLIWRCREKELYSMTFQTKQAILETLSKHCHPPLLKHFWTNRCSLQRGNPLFRPIRMI